MRPALALGAALLCACAAAHTPPTPDSKEVDSLALEGPKQLKASDLKKKLVTGESSLLPWWVPGLGRVEWYDPSTWQADLRRITRFYEANGYYQAHLVDEKVTETRPGHVKLLVKLTEGNPSRLSTLEVKGLEALAPEHRARVLSGLPLAVGDVFVEEKWAAAKTQLNARLRELGYAETVVSGEAVVDADLASVQATLEAAPGTRYRFGQILVATDPGAQVPAKLVADQATPDLRPGDWYSESALAEAQGRVFQMGVFGAVKVNRGAPDRQEGTVPIVIDVREAPFRSLRFGPGLAFDMFRQEAHLTAEYVDRNLGFAHLFNRRALLDRLSLKAKVGAAVVGLFSQLQGAGTLKVGPVLLGSADYEVPRLFSLRTLTLQSTLTLTRTLEPAYDYSGGELRFGVVWRPRLDLSIFPSVNFDAYFLNSEIQPGANAPVAAIGCPKWPVACVISFLDVTAEWDRRDNKLEPREGFYAGLDVQAGLSETTRVTPYFRVSPEGRGYTSFGFDKRFTLAGKVRLGTLLAAGNDTPILARFYSGGSAMRGFNQRRLSPFVAVATTLSAKNPDGSAKTDEAGNPVYVAQTLPIGGSGLLEGSLELRYRISESVVLALFVDAGLVTWEPLGVQLTLDSLYTALGLGVRYQTPVGPIRFDLAYRLPLGGPQQVFTSGTSSVEVPVSSGCFFGFGSTSNPVYAGSPENLCTWHLSIGEAF